MLASKKARIYLVLILLICLVLAGFLLWYSGNRTEPSAPEVTPRPARTSSAGNRPSFLPEETTVSAEVIQEQLQDVGSLVTEEYYFTEVVNYSTVKKIWKIEIGITESAFLVSYDGVVTAGLDFSGIKVAKDEGQKQIFISLPACRIMNVDIFPDSMQVYSEKTGFNNPLSTDDYNAALMELEQRAEQKALERGVLEKADSNARQVIRQCVGGLIDTTEYTIVFTGP